MLSNKKFITFMLIFINMVLLTLYIMLYITYDKTLNEIISYKNKNEMLMIEIQQLEEKVITLSSNKMIYVIEYKNLENNIILNDWSDYFPRVNKNAKKDIIGKSLDQVTDILGQPYITVKEITKTDEEYIRYYVYHPNTHGEDVDNTGITLKIENNIVVDYNVGDTNSFDVVSLKYLITP